MRGGGRIRGRGWSCGLCGSCVGNVPACQLGRLLPVPQWRVPWERASVTQPYSSMDLSPACLYCNDPALSWTIKRHGENAFKMVQPEELLLCEDFVLTNLKNMSQKLSLLLLIFGFIWGLMLLRYTFQHPRHQSSTELREQILDLSKRYVKALAEENKNIMNGGNGASMAGYADLKRTIAVLLDDILQRLGKLENKVDYIVVNGSATNTTNGTSSNLVPVTTSKRVNAANIR